MIGTHRKETQGSRGLLKELQKKKKEKKKEKKVIGDENRHDQNYSKMKKIKKKSLRYNNKRNITKDCMAYFT